MAINYTATIEPRNKGATVVLLEADGEAVGCVWFNKPYEGISCGQLRFMDKSGRRREDTIFALATPESVAERPEFIIRKYIFGDKQVAYLTSA